MFSIFYQNSITIIYSLLPFHESPLFEHRASFYGSEQSEWRSLMYLYMHRLKGEVSNL